MAGPWKRLASVFTTPLFPEDYAGMFHPLLGRELRGRVDSIEVQGDFTTLHITPGPGISPHFRAGQFIGVGLQIDGRFVWRSYSLTSVPGNTRRQLSISIKPVPDGMVSHHVVHTMQPGQLIRLTAPAGDFYLPRPLPAKIAMVTAGAGITPVISMLRWLDQDVPAGEWPDIVHIHSERAPVPSAPYGAEVARWSATIPQYTMIHWDSSVDGRVSPAQIAELVPDMDDRVRFACGPGDLLDALTARWPETTTEKFFSPLDGAGTAGGTITFGDTGVTAESNGTTTILEAGEAAGLHMVHGCRMGICRTCVSTVSAGVAVDLRDGTQYAEGEHVRTCVSVPCGPLTICAGQK